MPTRAVWDLLPKPQPVVYTTGQHAHPLTLWDLYALINFNVSGGSTSGLGSIKFYMLQPHVLIKSTEESTLDLLII